MQLSRKAQDPIRQSPNGTYAELGKLRHSLQVCRLAMLSRHGTPALARQSRPMRVPCRPARHLVRVVPVADLVVAARDARARGDGLGPSEAFLICGRVARGLQGLARSRVWSWRWCASPLERAGAARVTAIGGSRQPTVMLGETEAYSSAGGTGTTRSPECSPGSTRRGWPSRRPAPLAACAVLAPQSWSCTLRLGVPVGRAAGVRRAAARPRVRRRLGPLTSARS